MQRKITDEQIVHYAEVSKDLLLSIFPADRMAMNQSFMACMSWDWHNPYFFKNTQAIGLPITQ
jgi:hypothetical protein